MMNFIRWFCVIGTAFATLIFLVDVMSIFRRAVLLPHISTLLVIKMGLLRVPYLFEQVAPIVMLVATMVCLWSLNRRNELVIIKAIGGSFRQIMLPFLLVGIVIGAVDLVLLNSLSRFMVKRFEFLEARHLQHGDQQFLASENGIWTRLIEENNSRIYRIASINRKTGVLRGISVLFFDRAGVTLHKRIDAELGQLDGYGALNLAKAWIVSPASPPYYVETISVQSKLQQKDIEERYLNPKLLSFWQIPKIIHLLEKSGIIVDAYSLYWHASLARVFWMLGMILAGGIFLMHPLREGGVMTKSLLTLGAGFFLFTFREISLAMGLSGVLPIQASAWIPVGVSLFLPLGMLIHKEEG
ncbi:MAG: LptF/LptG family permease [Alphaproteobacteria bacterium]|nr:MAG: LptF/LptG family permease [Alphaproteobacteria bacterium]